jgi:hypothetical protein
MPPVEPRPNLMRTINSILARVARLESRAVRTLPQTYPLLAPTSVYQAVATTTWTRVLTSTVARATGGVQAVLATRVDAGTTGAVQIRIGGVAAPSLHGGAQPTVPLTGGDATSPARTLTAVVAVPGGPIGDPVDVEVWAQRVTGTGSVYVAGLALLGVPR